MASDSAHRQAGPRVDGIHAHRFQQRPPSQRSRRNCELHPRLGLKNRGAYSCTEDGYSPKSGGSMINPRSSGISSPGPNPMSRKGSAIRVPKPFLWCALTLEAMRRLLFRFFNFAGRCDLSFIFLEPFATNNGNRGSRTVFPRIPASGASNTASRGRPAVPSYRASGGCLSRKELPRAGRPVRCSPTAPCL